MMIRLTLTELLTLGTTSQWCACCKVYATRTEARQRLVRERARRAMRELRIMPAQGGFVVEERRVSSG